MIDTRIKQLREEFDYTQEDIARILGCKITARTIGYYENDDRLPTLQTAMLLADAFDVSLDYLLCKTDVRSNKLDINRRYISVVGELDKNNISEKQLEKAIQYIKDIMSEK